METFELWDAASGDLLDEFASEAQVLESLRAAIRQHGPAVASTLVLTRGAGASATLVGRGLDIARLVEAGLPQQ